MLELDKLEKDMEKDGLEPNSNFQGLMVSKVIDNRDPLLEGRVKVFDPKVMPQSSYDETPVSINYMSQNNNIINKNSYGNTSGDLNQVNGIWARPTQLFESGDPTWNENKALNNSGSLRVPRIGSHVFLYFLDGDPNKCYYLPLSPTFNGEKISSQFGSPNSNDPEKQRNIDIIRKYWNEMRIETDTNENENSISLTVVRQQNGKPTQEFNRIKIEDGNVKQITIIQAKKHSIVINDTQIVLTNANGTQIIMDGDKVTIIGDTDINGNVKISGKLSVGSSATIAGDAVISGISFVGHTHKHGHSAGTTGPPQ